MSEREFIIERVNSLSEEILQMLDKSNTIFLDYGHSSRIECDILIKDVISGHYQLGKTRNFSKVYYSESDDTLILIIDGVDFRNDQNPYSGYFQVTIMRLSDDRKREPYFSLLTDSPGATGPLTRLITKYEEMCKFSPHEFSFLRGSGSMTKAAK